MGLFVLRVKELEEGISNHRFELSRDWLKAEFEGVEGIEPGASNGKAELEATRHGAEVMLRGTVRVGLEVDCVRCLDAFGIEIDIDVDALMVPGKPVKGASQGKTDKERKDAPDEEDDKLGIERYQGEEIVLDGLLRDAILLEIPMSPNCGEDCKGWDALQG